LDYLNSAAALDLDGPGCGEALIALSDIQAKLAGARVRLLRRFDALDGHDADGYGSSTPWLMAKAGRRSSSTGGGSPTRTRTSRSSATAICGSG
jgi:hypothetical protein